jgi:hypothetical protein
VTAYTLTQITPDHYSIDWAGKWVYKCRHPWMGEAALSILRDMGDPNLWRGCFGTALRRRVWRLWRVVPCTCEHGRQENRGSGHRFQMCRRIGEHETYLGEPHEARKLEFDKWLNAKEMSDEQEQEQEQEGTQLAGRSRAQSKGGTNGQQEEESKQTGLSRTSERRGSMRVYYAEQNLIGHDDMDHDFGDGQYFRSRADARKWGSSVIKAFMATNRKYDKGFRLADVGWGAKIEIRACDFVSTDKEMLIRLLNYVGGYFLSQDCVERWTPEAKWKAADEDSTPGSPSEGPA